ncbi:MAG: hypothetical protein LBH39_07980 [Clostridiales Family XIII bacterium]|jgi:hypothetical protein|nr:hypothetical protein [Clostridiales Family XIII bacterium]
MYAIEFETTIRDGKIEIPTEYMSRFSTGVRVILMPKESEKSIKAKGEKGFGFGALSSYANPALWEQETGAWEKAAVEKYENR